MKKYFSVIVILFLLIIITLVSSGFIDKSRDFLAYQYVYNRLDYSTFEVGFRYLMMFFRDYIGLTLIESVTIISFFTLTIKFFIYYKLKSNNFIIYLFVYVFTFYLLHELTQYRVSIALCFISLAIYFSAQKKNLTSLFFILVSSTFHASTIVFLISPIILYFVKYNRVKWLVLLGVLLSVILSLLVSSYSDLILFYRPSAKGYLENWHDYSIDYFTPSKSLVYLLFYFFFLYINNKSTLLQQVVFTYGFTSLMTAIIFTAIPEVSIRFFDIASFIALYIMICIPFRMKINIISVYILLALMILYKIIGYIFYFPLFSN